MEHTFWYISLLSLHEDKMEFCVFYRIKTQDYIFFAWIQNSTEFRIVKLEGIMTIKFKRANSFLCVQCPRLLYQVPIWWPFH